MKVVRPPLTAILILALTACASYYEPPNFRDKTSTIHVLAIESQQGLKVQYIPAPSAAMMGLATGGGLGMAIGAVIDQATEARLSNELDSKISLYKHMFKEFSFNTQFSSAIETQTGEVSWGNTSKVKSLAFPKKFRVSKYLATVKEDTLIVLKPEYSFSPDLDAINVGVYLSVHDNLSKEAATALRRPVKKTYLQYQSRRLNASWRLPTPEEMKVEISKVKKNHAERMSGSIGMKNYYKKELKKELRKLEVKTLQIESSGSTEVWNEELLQSRVEQGIEQVSQLLVLHLNDQRTTQEYEALERKIPMINSLGEHSSNSVIAYELAKLGDATVYRTTEGGLYSVPSGDILRKPASIRKSNAE